MKYDNYYVTNLIIPLYYLGDEEKVFLLESRICKKTPKGYIDIETDAIYSQSQVKGLDRVDYNTLVPLNMYYNAFGLKKRNDFQNKKEVYQKVKSLKAKRKI